MVARSTVRGPWHGGRGCGWSEQWRTSKSVSVAGAQAGSEDKAVPSGAADGEKGEVEVDEAGSSSDLVLAGWEARAVPDTSTAAAAANDGRGRVETPYHRAATVLDFQARCQPRPCRPRPRRPRSASRYLSAPHPRPYVIASAAG